MKITSDFIDTLYLLAIPFFMLLGTCFVHVVIHYNKKRKAKNAAKKRSRSSSTSSVESVIANVDALEAQDTRIKFGMQQSVSVDSKVPIVVVVNKQPEFDPVKKMEYLDHEYVKKKNRKISQMHLDPIQAMQVEGVDRFKHNQYQHHHLDPIKEMAALDMADAAEKKRRVSRRYLDPIDAMDDERSLMRTVVVASSAPGADDGDLKLRRISMNHLSAGDVATTEARIRKISRQHLEVPAEQPVVVVVSEVGGKLDPNDATKAIIRRISRVHMDNPAFELSPPSPQPMERIPGQHYLQQQQSVSGDEKRRRVGMQLTDHPSQVFDNIDVDKS